MSQHTNEVLVKTILIPGVLLGIVIFAAKYGADKFDAKHDEKVQIYQAHQGRLAEIKTTKRKIEPMAKNFPEWKNFAFPDSRANMDSGIRQLQREMDPAKVAIVETKDDTSNPFGDPKKKLPMSVRTYTQKWDGTFREIQRSLIRQEERKPLLHLVSMTMRPSTSGMLDMDTLSVDVVYAAWEGSFRMNNSYIGDTIIERKTEEQKTAEESNDTPQNPQGSEEPIPQTPSN